MLISSRPTYETELNQLKQKLLLIVTSYPGQPSTLGPAPSHLREKLTDGYDFPFIALASHSAFLSYARDRGLIEPDPEYGSW